MTLFADLSPAQLDNVGQAFEEQWFQPGERAQRQGFVGTGFHVILDGEAEWRVDGQLADRTATTLLSTKPMTLKRGDWFGELSILFDEPSISDVVAVTLAPLHRARLTGSRGLPLPLPAGDVPPAARRGAAARDPMRWR